MMKEVAAFKTHAQFKTRVQNHTLFETKMSKTDILFLTKTAKQLIPFGASHAYRAHIGENPLPRGGYRWGGYRYLEKNDRWGEDRPVPIALGTFSARFQIWRTILHF